MRKVQNIIAIGFFIFLFISLSSNLQGQEIANYLFLEVVDSDDKPVKDAIVETPRSYDKNQNRIITTDKYGRVRFVTQNRTYFTYSIFKVSKPGYFTYQDLGVPIIDYLTRVKLELLKIPKNKNERKVLGNEQLKRDFMWAAKTGDSKTIRKLLRKGINPNITMNDFRGINAPKDISAIAFAASSGDSKTVRTLLKAGAKVRNIKQPKPSILGYYIWSESFRNRYKSTKDSEKTKLMSDYVKGAKSLLKAGAKTENFYDSGINALMMAANENYLDLVKLLIDEGEDVNAKTSFGGTALMYALENNRLSKSSQAKVFEILLKSGADPNVLQSPQDESACMSVLMKAVLRSNIEVIKLLIANKANVNLTCRNGANALSWATKYNSHKPNYLEIVKLLLTSGARKQ